MCSCNYAHTLTVSNGLDTPRAGEMVEVDAGLVSEIVGEGAFRIIAADGSEVPYQLTYDGKLIFPADVPAKGSAVYSLVAGQPAPVDTVATGALYAWRKDDLTWENDLSAFRAYGPDLQKSGERAFGYDIWTKSVPYPVVPERYRKAEKGVWFHTDYGDGLDVYSVGPTLGGGTAALIDSAGSIVYPYCFTDYEILDNGPLRFTVRLKYGAGKVDADTAVVESRIISLDKGEYLNRTTVSYDGLSAPAQIAPGIVVHSQNPQGYTLADSFMAYSDLTDNPDKGNGIIFVGVVAPEASYVYEPLAEPAGAAIGHILAKSSYNPGEEYTYWWGSGWSKAKNALDEKAWNAYLADFAKRAASPLKVTVK